MVENNEARNNRVSLEEYQEEDLSALHSLWNRTVGQRWQLDIEKLHDTIDNPNYSEGDRIVAKKDGRIVGILIGQSKEKTSSVVLIIVDPSYQRQGIGSRLLEEHTQRAKAKGLKKIQIATGAHDYFWPGIPPEMSSAVKFFSANGFSMSGSSIDMVQALAEYTTPKWVYERLPEDVEIRVAEDSEIEQVLDFEKKNFPNWYRHFVKHLKAGDQLVIAKRGDKIVGSVVTIPFDKKTKAFWSHLIGEKTGGIGALGVIPGEREKGIGLALAARVTEILKESGATHSFVGWTWLKDWYSKLGYSVWAEFQEGYKKI